MADGDVTPLEVLIRAMRHEVSLQSKRPEMDRDYAKAAGYAKDAAPYCHPRLAAVSHTGKDGEALESSVSSLELARRYASLLFAAESMADEKKGAAH